METFAILLASIFFSAFIAGYIDDAISFFVVEVMSDISVPLPQWTYVLSSSMSGLLVGGVAIAFGPSMACFGILMGDVLYLFLAMSVIEGKRY